MKSEEKSVQIQAHRLERACWLLVFMAMLTQLSTANMFPSYNLVLGFWGVYCSLGKHGRATFGFIVFSFLGIILDVTFCIINSGVSESSIYKFCLAIFILCLFLKAYVVYVSAYLFAAIGGAQSMETSRMEGSIVYESLAGSVEHSQTGGYFPPERDVSNSQSSFTSAYEGQTKEGESSNFNNF